MQAYGASTGQMVASQDKASQSETRRSALSTSRRCCPRVQVIRSTKGFVEDDRGGINVPRS